MHKKTTSVSVLEIVPPKFYRLLKRFYNQILYRMKSYIPGEISVRDLHGILLGAIAPRPIAFVSTIDLAGNSNLSPFSFFNMFGANPPIFVFSPSRRGRDNTTKHTYHNVKEVPEVVINLVNYATVHQVN